MCVYQCILEIAWALALVDRNSTIQCPYSGHGVALATLTGKLRRVKRGCCQNPTIPKVGVTVVIEKERKVVKVGAIRARLVSSNVLRTQALKCTVVGIIVTNVVNVRKAFS